MVVKFSGVGVDIKENKIVCLVGHCRLNGWVKFNDEERKEIDDLRLNAESLTISPEGDDWIGAGSFGIKNSPSSRFDFKFEIGECVGMLISTSTS